MTNPLLGLSLGVPNGSIFDKPSPPAIPKSAASVSVSGLGGVAKTVADLEQAHIAEALQSGPTGISDIPVSDIPLQTTYADRIVSAAKNFLLPDAESFQAVLDALDSSLSTTEELDLLSLTQVRSYVQAVMVTMQKDEELTKLILPRDIRNVIRFARLQHAETQTMKDLEKAAPPKLKKVSSTKAIANMPKMDF